MTSAAVVMPSLASFLRVAGGARGGEMAGAVMRGVYLLTLLCDHGLSAKRGAVVCPCLVCAIKPINLDVHLAPLLTIVSTLLFALPLALAQYPCLICATKPHATTVLNLAANLNKYTNKKEMKDRFEQKLKPKLTKNTSGYSKT
jgi:hypothetical protein